MVNCSMVRSVLVAVIVVVVSGHPVEKLFTCCKKVSTSEITEPIIKFEIQKPNPPCVTAVIFTTKTGHYCSHLNSPWVFQKIKEFRRATAQSPAPLVTSSPPPSSSLLSIITSTRLSSSSPPFFSSTSTIGESETLSGTREQ